MNNPGATARIVMRSHVQRAHVPPSGSLERSALLIGMAVRTKNFHLGERNRRVRSQTQTGWTMAKEGTTLSNAREKETR